MSQIKISVPNDDSCALFHIGKSLIDMSSTVEGAPRWMVITQREYDDLKALQCLKQATEDLMQAAPAMMRENDVDGSIEIHGKRKEAEPDTTAQQVESLGEAVFSVNGVEMNGEPAPDVSITTDSAGTPWDERIHSASKALNSDGTWRVRRKPADKTPEEWADYIKWVEEDIHLAESLRPEDDGDITPEETEEWEKTKQPDYLPEPPITPAGDDFHVDAGVVSEQEIAAIPAPPPPPVFATVQEVDEMLGLEPDYTFPQVMQFLTERHGRITSPEVDQIITDMGLSSIMDLNTQPEHTGPFIARVKAHLGE